MKKEFIDYIGAVLCFIILTNSIVENGLLNIWVLIFGALFANFIYRCSKHKVKKK